MKCTLGPDSKLRNKFRSVILWTWNVDILYTEWWTYGVYRCRSTDSGIHLQHRNLKKILNFRLKVLPRHELYMQIYWFDIIICILMYACIFPWFIFAFRTTLARFREASYIYPLYKHRASKKSLPIKVNPKVIFKKFLKYTKNLKLIKSVFSYILMFY